jgi:hypothetical protein
MSQIKNSLKSSKASLHLQGRKLQHLFLGR